MTITPMLCATRSCSSRAIRARSSATARAACSAPPAPPPRLAPPVPRSRAAGAGSTARDPRCRRGRTRRGAPRRPGRPRASFGDVAGQHRGRRHQRAGDSAPRSRRARRRRRAPARRRTRAGTPRRPAGTAPRTRRAPAAAPAAAAYRRTDSGTVATARSSACTGRSSASGPLVPVQTDTCPETASAVTTTASAVRATRGQSMRANRSQPASRSGSPVRRTSAGIVRRPGDGRNRSPAGRRSRARDQASREPRPTRGDRHDRTHADRRTGGAAVAGGLLLSASVAAELRPAGPGAGRHGRLAGPGSRSTWPPGRSAPPRSSSPLHGLGAPPAPPRGRIGPLVGLAGAGLLIAFGLVGLGTALVIGAPAECVLPALRGRPAAAGRRRRSRWRWGCAAPAAVAGWWTAVLVAGAGALSRCWSSRPVARPRPVRLLRARGSLLGVAWTQRSRPVGGPHRCAGQLRVRDGPLPGPGRTPGRGNARRLDAEPDGYRWSCGRPALRRPARRRTRRTVRRRPRRERPSPPCPAGSRATRLADGYTVGGPDGCSPRHCRAR